MTNLDSPKHRAHELAQTIVVHDITIPTSPALEQKLERGIRAAQVDILNAVQNFCDQSPTLMPPSLIDELRRLRDDLNL